MPNVEFESVLIESLPRKALFKVGNHVNSTVKKKEQIEYHSKQAVTRVSTHEQVVDFHISGECLLDGRSSYFSLELWVNSWTAVLSNDITSIIKKVEIFLPSNGNIKLESISEYAALNALISTVHVTENQQQTNRNVQMTHS